MDVQRVPRQIPCAGAPQEGLSGLPYRHVKGSAVRSGGRQERAGGWVRKQEGEVLKIAGLHLLQKACVGSVPAPGDSCNTYSVSSGSKGAQAQLQAARFDVHLHS